MSCCVQERSAETLASIKRHPAQICYSSPPWIWHPQQFRQRLRHIPSNGGYGRGASTTCGATVAGNATAHASASTTSVASCARCAAAPAYVSMTSNAIIARCAAAPAYVSMTSNAICARCAAAPAYASMASGSPIARRAAAPAYASMASIETLALSARTSHAPWKAAHNSVTVSALSIRCCTTCAPTTVVNPRRSPSPRS